MLKNKLIFIIKTIFDEEINVNKFKIINFNFKNLKKKNYIVILKKKEFKHILKFIFNLILNRKKIKKNFYLLYNFKSSIIVQNLFPQWPGVRFNQSFYKNLFVWVKLFSYVFFYRKYLSLIILKVY